MIKKRKFGIILLISLICIVLGIVILDDTSFLLIGVGIIFLAIAIKIYVSEHKEKFMNK